MTSQFIFNKSLTYSITWCRLVDMDKQHQQKENDMDNDLKRRLQAFGRAEGGLIRSMEKAIDILEEQKENSMSDLETKVWDMIHVLIDERVNEADESLGFESKKYYKTAVRDIVDSIMETADEIEQSIISEQEEEYDDGGCDKYHEEKEMS